MADPKTHILHPSDIALQDTSAYNERFNEIIRLRKLAQEEPDSLRKEEISEIMHGIAAEIEDFHATDTTVVDVGPLLDMWEIEGKGSFGAFAEEMRGDELEASFQSVSDSSDISLSPAQYSAASEGLKIKKEIYEQKKNTADAWEDYRANVHEEMGTIWDRYEAIKDADPDKDWWAESRFVWWGIATPDNAIQAEIASLGREYRELDIKTKMGPPPSMMGFEVDRAETDYTTALTALKKLKGK